MGDELQEDHGSVSSPTNERDAESQSEHVTYVVVVHGIGEQRKNECVINVVNRFAEARRQAEEGDNRDVLTLGKASSQTGFSKARVTGQPWLEFDGIPASANAPAPGRPFLGELAKKPGENLRFVDLCWSDIMQDSIEHVGQDVDLWAKGLLGRLLRKHDAAKTDKEKVPFWIRRILYLLADTLLLVRFAMNFRFKEMKDLVFVKFLGDVQLYGEYSRCRGQAIRRFHELLARVEAAHSASERSRDCETRREAHYVVIAHSLGSIMSLDALLYASATSEVRRGSDHVWKFPGYLRDDEKKSPSNEEGWFAPLDTGWIQRVQSFVTLGSPIDKYLMLWWLNYRYLLKSDGRLRPRKQPNIKHFNYCDELDPVGHNLDVVRRTPVYKKVFKCKEDVVFNRYSLPGVAHNKYWTDQRLFSWILHKAADPFGGNAGKPPRQPRWFREREYRKLLRWLYCRVALLVVLGTYTSISLALQTDGWRTAAVATAAFGFLAGSGRRLIDLSIWWRQIQRHKSATFWAAPRNQERRDSRDRLAKRFRRVVAVVPVVWAALTATALLALHTGFSEAVGSTDWFAVCCDSAPGDRLVRLLLIVTVFALVAYLLRRSRLPTAYGTRAVDDRTRRSFGLTSLAIAGCLATCGAAAVLAIRFVPTGLDTLLDQAALFGVVATAVYTYRLYRFRMVKNVLRPDEPEKISFKDYAGCASRVDDA